MKTILFEMARRQILIAGLADNAAPLLDDALLFAWSARVFPVLRPGRLEVEFADDFPVSKQMMVELSERLRRILRLRETISFYELEAVYEVRPHQTQPTQSGWDRFKLIDAVRYFYLADGAEEDDFYRGFIVPGGAPAEANDFMRPFNASTEVRFD